jgi:hypothetical protein
MSKTIAQVLLQNGYADERHFDECVSELRDLFLELIGPHESLSEKQVADGRIYVLGDPQADAVDRYRDELATKAKSL